MPLQTASQPRTQRLEMLSPEGALDPTFKPDVPDELLLRAYRLMVEIRLFDERALKLQRQGRLGTYPQILGQEASQVIPALCLEPRDWLVPTYRGQGAYYARGMKLRYSLLYWAGDDRGTQFGQERDMIFAIPVGTHLTQVAGLAWASKLRGEGAVALAYLGDGTSSKGDLHEALTFAGQFRLPAIYVIENNHWAISVPRERQSAARTLAEKAWSYGCAGLQVDGNDALAVFTAARRAIARAREGLGCTVIECETYRLGHHTTADDASRYRSESEVATWTRKDPIARLRGYLERRGLWDQARDQRLRSDSEAMIQAEVDAYEALPAPNPLNMFADNYATAPWTLVEQRAELERLLAAKTQRHEIEALPPTEGRFP